MMAEGTIHIHGGHLVDPANGIDAPADLYLADGRIAAIGKAPDGFSAALTLDASGLYVIPGLVDLCARLREPGQEHKANIDSECRAAAASGITTLCCPPDTTPVIDTPAVVELIRHRAGQTRAARVVSLGDLALIQQTGVRAHFCRLTTERAVRMVARAQFDGLPVSADVAVPYLYLSELDASEFNPDFHFIPPLRTQNDRNGLVTGLRDGTLGALCSDHQPHEADAKLAPFPATEPGASGLETLLPLTLKLVQEKHLTLSEAIARVTCGPAAILNLPCGELGVGRVADLCLFDAAAHWQVKRENLLSQGKNTPFTGWEMPGQVRYTLRDGQIIFRREAR